MLLDLGPPRARIVILLVLHGIKGIANGQVDIFMGMVFVIVFMSHQQLFTRHGQINAHLKEPALIIMAMRTPTTTSQLHSSQIVIKSPYPGVPWLTVYQPPLLVFPSRFLVDQDKFSACHEHNIDNGQYIYSHFQYPFLMTAKPLAAQLESHVLILVENIEGRNVNRLDTLAEAAS